MFGARRKAEEYRDALARAEAALQALNGMSYLQIQEATAQAQADLARLAQEADQTRREVAGLEARLLDVRSGFEVQDVGLYDFEHPAEDSAQLAGELAAVRAQIKETARRGEATLATKNFTFNNSTAKGAKFVAALSKLMLSAYNAEAENAVKTVKAGNLATATERLNRVVERVAKNGEMIDLRIAPQYHALRLRELSLASRHLQAVQTAKELEREERARLREEQKAAAELAREREKLEKEQQHYLNALEALRARGDAQKAAEMEAKLAEIAKSIEDVDYRTANQRAGYVYVISNVGAFGPDMVKIGMTRRLDPMDRVRELGDASVPFRYDAHALFFAADAVAVETMLHQRFAAARVNKVNPRREFFRVTPHQVLEALKEQGVALVEFKLEPEAEEYRQSGGQVARPDLAA
ncbi:MAG: DUF4041 domain-containing protein [Bifidobacteriaceae bacterium]|nr:DUF4041 domain-containing protein [Bifidobacteriaceae bacterium]